MTSMLAPVALLGALLLLGRQTDPTEPPTTSGDPTAPGTVDGDTLRAEGTSPGAESTPSDPAEPGPEVQGTVLERVPPAPPEDPATTTSVPLGRVPCDDAAVAAALSDAPIAQELVEPPVCSSTFAVAATRDEQVPSDELLVILRRSDVGWEAVAVIRPEYCSRLPEDEPGFDVSMCPS